MRAAWKPRPSSIARRRCGRPSRTRYPTSGQLTPRAGEALTDVPQSPPPQVRDPVVYDSSDYEDDRETEEYQDGASKLAAIIKRYEVSPFLLDPRSKWMKRWDMIIAVALVYTATVTPYEVAFLDTKPGYRMNSGLPTFPIYLINVLIDITFFTDMCFNFNLIYLDEVAANGSYVTDRGRIVRRYLRGFFVVDLMSIIPYHEMDAGGLKVLKLLRLLRLFKLLRILRSGRILKRLEDSMNVDYNVLALFKFILGTLMIAHWLACIWQLLARTEGNKDDWVSNYYSNWVDADRMSDCYDASEFRNEFLACCGISTWSMYISSLYWALVTMSTIGYGDILPTTTAERFFVVCAMLIGTSVFAYVVGSVCTIVASMDKKSSEHHELMDTLNAMARELHIKEDLQMRCRDFFRYRHSSTNLDDWRLMLELMSPDLRGEVAMMQCGPWINNVPFFRGAPDNFIVDVALNLKSETFPQGETIVKAGALSTKLFIVERGVVGGKGRVFTSGKTFGEEVLNGGTPTAFTARAMTYCDVFSLQGRVIEDIGNNYPVMKRRLRVAGCRGMLKDALVAFEHAWSQIARGHTHSPDVPEELPADASLADLAVKNRTDAIFAFALSLSKGGTGRPSIPEDSEGVFRAKSMRNASFRVREQPPEEEENGDMNRGGTKAGEMEKSVANQVLGAMAQMQFALEERISQLELRIHP